jgi:hypothetical protein
MVNAVTEVLNALVMQLIDLNTSLSQIHDRMVRQGNCLAHIVDELRTLNNAVGRVEDFHYSTAQKGSPSA